MIWQSIPGSFGPAASSARQSARTVWILEELKY